MTMELLKSPSAMVRLSGTWRRRDRRIGFVPTMGALHDGHISLIRKAKAGNDRVVVSIFVNPLQFGPKEDYSRYPRTLSRDRSLCEAAGVDALFTPSADALYPEGFKTRVRVDGLSDVLDGEFRRGHFQGVATVVLKLFEMVRPDAAYFGEKDFQQLAILKRMALDLNLPVRVVGCPTRRDRDGLALSSRNAYLTPAERALAPRLYQALILGKRLAHENPGLRSARLLQKVAARLRMIPGLRVDYVRLVNAVSLENAPRARGNLRLLAAVRLGRTRLIDNIPVKC